MKKIGVLLVSVIAAMLLVSAVFAADPGGATVSNIADLGEYGGSAAGTVDVEAGNVTQANLDANMSTLRWVGLLGNVSGNILLADSNNDTLYTWVAEGNLVYASRGTPVWASLADASEAQVIGVDTWLADNEGSDNYSNTFTGGSVSIGSNIFTLSSDHANTTSNGGTDWPTYSLWDTATVVYASEVNAGNQAYDGGAVDYQILLPENGLGNSAPTTYNLWVELV